MSGPKVGLAFFPAFDWAISPTHPEREERLLYTRDQIEEEGLWDLPNLVRLQPRLATDHEIARVHICVPTVQEEVPTPHRVAAGAAVVSGMAVLEGQVERAFVLVRPPGHHAHRVVRGQRGFCLINNEAIMIEALRRAALARDGRRLRVAIVDTDAHHADGSQDIYYNDPDILHICIHQDGRTLYPGTGFVHELGGPGAYGLTINVPVPPYTGDEGLLYIMDNLVRPLLDDFQPDLVVNGAGQDNHYSDPLTNMMVSAQGYAQLTEKLRPDIVVLEGGYSVEGALPYVNVGILLALAGQDTGRVREPDYDAGALRQAPQVTEYIHRLVDQIRQIWEHRRELAEENLAKLGVGPNQWLERQRTIYYDTDDILEEQDEAIRICPDCSGVRIIRSAAQRQGIAGPLPTAHIVVLPPDACPACRQKAEERYQAWRAKGEKYVYLQDGPDDVSYQNGDSV
ncbi:MAG: histone deacetylase [Firmicutes bacterium]|nr:histone deacetylase [Bacillota bacterium]